MSLPVVYTELSLLASVQGLAVWDRVFCGPSGLHTFEQVSLLPMGPSKGTAGKLGFGRKI